MPTVLCVGPYRFFFYSGDGSEPAHIHIQRDDNVAKFWLDPVALQAAGRFSRVEINRIAIIVNRYQSQLLKAWDAFFVDRD